MAILILAKLTPVEHDLESTYTLQQDSWWTDIFTDAAIDVGSIVSNELEANYGITVEADTESICNIRWFLYDEIVSNFAIQVWDDTLIPYPIKVSSDTDHTFKIGDLSADLDVTYSLRHFAFNDLDSLYTSTLPVFFSSLESNSSILVAHDVESPYSIRHITESDTESVYSIMLTVQADTVVDFNMIREVESILVSNYNISVLNPVYAQDLVSIYMIEEPTTETSYVFFSSVGGIT